ncbi:efflux RND transporter periplasmic adaptor subunit [Ichthyobacterium seriolicida]|uniref:Cation transporter n=1 Tax=Ichthyobacterium seriolicida TaxID=242600 RepID=A0A1J1E1A2_9FLAO|nr:efflux RND transporter periplasmic adaptor subunit [Ichthyobacterium seriolicida]BAV94725.1 cation transporter [Ichthyobacterium seriolicida]
MKYTNTIIRYTLIVLFFSCGEKESNKKHSHGHSEKSHSHDSHDHGDKDDHDSHVSLSRKQINTIELEFGYVSTVKVNDFIKATGTLGAPPKYDYHITSKAPGFLRIESKYVEGEYIKKGAIISYLENSSLITKQQEYLEVKSKLELKKMNLNRQRELVSANAGIIKELQKVQSEYDILETQYISLSKQLEYLGISTRDLTSKNITERIEITSPTNGYITGINMRNGMYTESNNYLMEIISSEHLHLELNVFEKDIQFVKVGQKISYNMPAMGNIKYLGEVSVIGKKFDNESRTVRVHGHLEGAQPVFLKDLFINAKIWLSDNTTEALPNESILKEDNQYFIYVAQDDSKSDEVEFKRINVIAGATENGFTAVKFLEEIPKDMKIVTKGAYYVFSESKKGSLAHEH